MIPEPLRDAWPCWRAITEGNLTWTEVTTTMTVEDVFLYCIALDTWPSSTYLRGEK